MTTIRILRLLAMQSIVIVVSSCVKAPLDITLKDKIEISEDEIKEIADDIYEKLAELEFDNPPPPTVPPAECSAAYKIWLRKQFDIGRVPKETITATVYGESSSNPNIHECRSIDFETEYKKAVQESVNDENRKRKAIVFGVSSFREALRKNKCFDRFLDLDKEKITITSIDLIVDKNTLSVKAPRYNLYSSYEDDGLKDEIESTMNAEDALVKDGTLMLLGQTQPIAKRFVGKSPVILNSDQDDFFNAEGPVVSLDGTLYAIPTKIASEPEIERVGTQEFYVVPSGKLVLVLATTIDVKFSTHDARCALGHLKESIAEEEGAGR